MLPEVMDALYDCKEPLSAAIDVLATRLNSRNSPIFWESQRTIDFLHTFLKRKNEVVSVERSAPGPMAGQIRGGSA
jgi:glyceraldehyde-3-phosphate dehydrogenase (ferredoxin)